MIPLGGQYERFDEGLLYAYKNKNIDRRIRDLTRERGRLVAELMPRSGSSLAKAGRQPGDVSDPTGKAAVMIAEHPWIRALNEDIAYWQDAKEKLARLVASLDEEERHIFAMCYGNMDLSPENTRGWNRVRRRRIKAGIFIKARRIWRG